MRQRHWSFWSCAAVVLVATAWCAPALAEPRIVSTEIEKVDTLDGAISFRLKGDLFSQSAKLAEDVEIDVNRRRAGIKDLAAGMKIVMRVDLDKHMIYKISARVKETPGRMKKPTEGEDAPKFDVTGECPEELNEIDRICQQFLAEEKVRGGAVVIVKDGKCVLARGYGYADRDRSVALEPTTLFPVEEISKVFTSAALARLSVDGSLAWDEPFFDSVGKQAVADEKKLPGDSRFVEASTLDFMKNNLRYRRDSFIQKYETDSDFRKDFNRNIESMPDGRAVEMDESTRYDVVDLQYVLLGRVVAKFGKGSYEQGIRSSVFEPLGITGPRVSTITLKKDEDDDSKPAPPPFQNKDAEPPAPAAEVEFATGRDFEMISMSLDSAGGWLASAMDLARFAKAFDDPENSEWLNTDAVTELLTPYVERGARPGTAYFASGWTVYAAAAEDPKPIQLRRRFVQGGTGLIASDDRLHVVFLLTTSFAPSRSGSEHPLLVELSHALGKVETWPEVDLFGAPASEAGPDAPVLAEGGEAMPDGSLPEGGLPDLVTFEATTGDRVESIVKKSYSLYDGFVSGGGAQLLNMIRSFSSPDFQRIAKQYPQGLSAAQAIYPNQTEELIKEAILTGTGLGPSDTEPRKAMEASMEFQGQFSNYFGAVVKPLTREVAPDDRSARVAEILNHEQLVMTGFVHTLAVVDEVYPWKAEPAANDAEFQRWLDKLTLRIQLIELKQRTILEGRSMQIRAIQAKGAAASTSETEAYRQYVKDIQTTADESAKLLDVQKTRAQEFLQKETEANSKYAPAWEAAVKWIDADLAYSTIVVGFGTKSFDREKSEIARLAVMDARQSAEDAKAAALGSEQASAEAAEAPATEGSADQK